MKGVKFGDFHSWRDFSLILAEKTIGSPTVKRMAISIPGADGELDLTEYFGDINYENRPLSFSFSTIIPRNEFLNLFSSIQNAIHGKRLPIILDDDPDFYYVGRITVSEWKANKNVGELTIDCDCEPYKYKLQETMRTEAISGTKTVILSNLRKRVNPVITTDAAMTIIYKNTSYALSGGTWTVPEIYLDAGNNTFQITGTGTISFKYQEGGL